MSVGSQCNRLFTGHPSILLRTLLAVLTVMVVSPFSSTGQEKSRKKLEIGDSMPQFSLRDFRGKSWTSEELANGKEAIVIVFSGVECPLVKLYSGRLKKYQSQFEGKLQIIAINSNRHDSVTEMEAFARETQTKFPHLKDPANRIADQFGAERTPEVFLFNKAQKLIYHGAIDDQYTYGVQRQSASNHYLRDAIAATLAGKAVKVPETKTDGCIIGRVLTAESNSNVTYANQISRLLNYHCVSCHRPGEIAPFSLTDYDEVVGWAGMIQEVVNDRRMPPWHANPAHGTFKNDISLKKEQLELINEWVKNGAPFGDKADLPPPPEYVEGWRIGQPDVVIPMSKKPFKVPAEGVIPYKHYVVETGFKEDKWISAAECRIGNRAVVHHIIVALHRDGSLAKHGQIDSEWITATAPGAQPLILPDGYAKLIPAGARLVFQMHYTPNGTEQTDISSVGFKFADPQTVKKSVGTREIINQRFAIPPGANNHEVKARKTLRQDSLLLGLFPHMHLRGKSFRYTAKYPDGNEEILLDVPNFDFNWQNGYIYPAPKPIPKGTTIECIAHFDNSKENFANPDPTETVYWGDQTFEEMMIGYFDMALADQDLTQKSKRPRTDGVMARIKANKPIVSKKLQASINSIVSGQNNAGDFDQALRESFPQIDRVCFTTFNDAILKVEKVSQPTDFARQVGDQGVKVDAEGTALYQVFQSGSARAFANLSQESAPDLEHMSIVAGSSFHMPLEIGDMKGTINFWSSETNGFPEPISSRLQKMLETAKSN